ncbi:MAG TPA: hypothetical protein VLB06_02635 [Sulfuricaulis sp.]|nr:hypothetical protein [Sulfuricaulis sp.]
MLQHFALRVCDRRFLIQSEDAESASFVRAEFGSMLVDPSLPSPVVRRYRIGRAPSGSGFHVATDDDEPVWLEDADGLLFHLDKDLTIALQLQRADLFFLHAAAVALDDRAVVLSAPSGTGKSTLALALLENGFDYLSDELAPIDVQRLTVHPFPHALCLKSPPPAPYCLPTGALRIGERYHVPADILRGRARAQSLPVAAFIFLRRGSRTSTAYRPISRGTAIAYLMSNALNSLAHPAAGLDVAAMLSKAAPCFELDSADLGAACQAVREMMQGDVPLRAN